MTCEPPDRRLLVIVADFERGGRRPSLTTQHEPCTGFPGLQGDIVRHHRRAVRDSRAAGRADARPAGKRQFKAGPLRGFEHRRVALRHREVAAAAGARVTGAAPWPSPAISAGLVAAAKRSNRIGALPFNVLMALRTSSTMSPGPQIKYSSADDTSGIWRASSWILWPSIRPFSHSVCCGSRLITKCTEKRSM